MARAANIYTLSLAANQTKEILADAGMYKVLSATGTIRISRTSGNALSPMLAGQGEREDFQRLSVTDISGTANNVTILVADRDFIDDRIYGEVSAIDGELARSKAGNSFSVTAAVGAVAGQYGYLELWNPAGSARRVIVWDAILSSSIALQTYIVRTNAQITAATAPYNKSSSGAAPAFTKYGQGNVAAVPGFVMEAHSLAAGIPLTRNFKQPYTLEPGAGLCVFANTVNVPIYGAMNFTEEVV